MLNEQQREAVLTTEGPLLILAGAGSGKTRVLTYRTAYLIDECGVNPYNIMAITFTNKAAGEMRERIDDMVGYGSESIWVSTFHSTCVRILRRYIDRLGYDTNFTIYDADDQKALMKDICKRLEIDTKMYKEKMFLNVISSAKDEMIDPIEFENRFTGDFVKRKQALVYKEYQNALKQNNALDFDDLLVKTVELFKLDKEVLDYYQERFRYIMVDEYQDTNTVQFELIRLLAMKYKNLCVVGDDDQSIYKFRGANIYNILNFEKHFEDAKVIKLEQNYRSTQNILDAANSVISNNVGRKDKRLWTDNGAGDRITFEQLESGFEEADYVARSIARLVRKGEARYKDCAVLYRTNAQSRLFEEKFIAANIPYKIVGGVNFYARKEIKDILAYLKTIDNGHDDLAVKRIINVPKRGIGATSINKVTDYALEKGIDFYTALRYVDEVPGMARSAGKIKPFVMFIQSLRARAEMDSVSQLIQAIIDETGYVDELKAEGTDEAEQRIENIDELINKAVDYEQGEDWNKGWETSECILMDINQLKALEQKYYKISGEKAPDTTNYDEVRVKCVDAASVAAVQQSITDMGFQCSSMEDTRKMFDEQLTMIQTMLGGLAAISLFVAAIGIANTMVMSIYERTKEIGVMKVLGAELGAIRAMFLTESAMIGLIGGVVGVGLSFLISYLLNNVPIVANLLASLGLSFGNGGAVSIIPWWLVLLAMVFSMMVGVVFGFIPANRAVKISALEAIRHD